MTKKKLIAIVVAAALVVCCAITGTLAWLTATSPKVTNTFTFGNIDVELTETKGGTNHDEFKMIPGWTIDKDPKAKVTAGSEDCYLFVKVEKSANFDQFMTYTIADGWTELTGVAGVYYRVFDSNDTTNNNVKGTAYPILKDNKVTVLETVDKGMMDSLNNGTTTKPTLSFTAYAVQLYKNNTEKFEAAEAWAKVPTPATP